MSVYEKHIFICQNEREPGNPLGCCSSKGAEEVTKTLKQLVKGAGLASKVRVNKSGCLGKCEHGVTAVVYPEGIWYENLDSSKATEIFESHIKNGKAVQALTFGNIADQ